MVSANFGANVDLGWLIDSHHVTHLLKRYFVPVEEYQDKGRQHFTGRFFEWHLERSEPDRFTESDILAVQRLSVTVPTRATYELLHDPGGRFRRQLARCRELIGGASDIRGLTDEELTAGPLVELYRNLLKLHGVGPTTASKLMAAKFPAHVPIQDSKVAAFLGTRGNKWWGPMKELLSEPGVAPALMAAELPGPKVELLRRLDVVLWMQA